MGKRIKHRNSKVKFDPAKPYIFLPDGKEKVKVLWAEIIYLEADSSYTHLHHTNGKKYTYSRDLIEFEISLPPDTFCRVHDSYLANIDHVKKVTDTQAIMDNKTFLPVSKSHKAQLLKMLPMLHH